MSNFGIIKNTYNNILSESITNKNKSNNKIFKGYIKTLKENQTLKKQFNIYYNIENSNFNDKLDAMLYLNENLNLLTSSESNNIGKLNNDLISKLNKVVLNKNLSNDLFKLYESIDFLLKNKNNINNLDKVHENKLIVVNYMVNNKQDVNNINENVGLPNSLLLNFITSKFNEKYKDLTESEIKIINSVISKNDKDKESLFLETISDCLTLVNENLKISDLEIKEKLLETKESLLKKVFNIETYDNDIAKLITLKENLS